MVRAVFAILLSLCAVSNSARADTPAQGAPGNLAIPAIPSAGSTTQDSTSSEHRPLGVPEIERRAIAPGLESPREREGWISSTLMPLLFVLALIILGAGLFRRISRARGGIASAIGAGGRAPAGVLSVLARYPVGGGVTLVLLQLDRRVLLVSHSPGSPLRGRPGSMSMLCDITDSDDVASILVRTQDERGESLTRRFNAVLSKMVSPRGVETLEMDDPVDLDTTPGPDPRSTDAGARGHQADPLRERLAQMRRRDGDLLAGAR